MCVCGDGVGAVNWMPTFIQTLHQVGMPLGSIVQCEDESGALSLPKFKAWGFFQAHKNKHMVPRPKLRAQQRFVNHPACPQKKKHIRSACSVTQIEGTQRGNL